MKKIIKILLPVALVVLLVVAVMRYLPGHNVAVLSPKGQVGQKERNLMELAILMSVLVLVPVYAVTIAIVVKYREGNKKPKKYSPDWDHSRLLESIWWGIPVVIITVLSVVAWNSSHDLDPSKALVSNNKPLHVQVIALDWKWLFVYPEQHVASVNLLEMPVNTPVDFDITSDTVMNSFWIPNLGGQIYAMPGMTTQLHLMASKAGSYPGSSANISGAGFAGMTFTAHAVSQNDFTDWAHTAQNSPKQMGALAYNQLAKPSQNNPVAIYAAASAGLYNDVLMKYMAPMPEMMPQ